VQLLETAFDAGVTYFDTARLYADGLAEGMIADAFRGRRDSVIITSKAGILPPLNTFQSRISGKLATIARKAPLLRGAIAAPVREPFYDVFDLPRLGKSVEASLRELKTDYLDALLLHECKPTQAFNADVVGFLERLKSEGKIRAFGVAPATNDMIAIGADGRPFGAIAQFGNSAFEDNMGTVVRSAGMLTITHSALAGRFMELVKRLSADEAAADRWRAAIDVDPHDTTRLAQVFLAYSLIRNPDGVVLFATTKPERIRGNIQAAELAVRDGELAGRLPAALAAALA